MTGDKVKSGYGTKCKTFCVCAAAGIALLISVLYFSDLTRVHYALGGSDYIRPARKQYSVAPPPFRIDKNVSQPSSKSTYYYYGRLPQYDILEEPVKDSEFSVSRFRSFYGHDQARSNYRHAKDSCQNNVNEKKLYTILFWTPFASGIPFWFGLGRKAFAHCTPFTNCHSLRRKSLAASSDALLVNHVLKSKNRHVTMPPRKNDQSYIIVSVEAPFRVRIDPTTYGGIFTAIASYQDESDIVLNWGTYIKRNIPLNVNHLNDNHAGRVRLAAWFCSNCVTPSKREVLVKELQNFVKIDVFGKCGAGNFTCPKDWHQNNACDRLLGRNYKFYLAFENSLCVEYVTEKPWRALNSDVVPVVYGGADYPNLLPPNSYINAREYTSPRQLADYLLYLSQNETAYNQFFQWKRDYQVLLRDLGPKPIACAVCRYLNDLDCRREKPRPLSSQTLNKFFNVRKNCLRAPNISSTQGNHTLIIAGSHSKVEY